MEISIVTAVMAKCKKENKMKTFTTSARSVIHDLLFVNNISKYKRPKWVEKNIALRRPLFKWFDPDDLIAEEHYKRRPKLLDDTIEDVSCFDLDAPLNYSLMQDMRYWGDDPEHDFAVVHVHKAPAKDVRHLPYNRYPVFVDIYSYKKESLAYAGFRKMFFWRPSGKPEDVDERERLLDCWRLVNPQGNIINNHIGEKTQDGALQPQIALALAMQFHADFLWHVDIGMPGCPKLRLYVDHDDVKALFKDREIEEGKRRRDSLLNWVMSHQRKKKTHNEYTTVKRHMRGCYPFHWDGLECIIVPSAEDVKKQIENIQSVKTAELVSLLEDAGATE